MAAGIQAFKNVQGPLQIGVQVSLILLGIVTCQLSTYLRQYFKKDSWYTKSFVLCVYLTLVLKAALDMATTYQTVSDAGLGAEAKRRDTASFLAFGNAILWKWTLTISHNSISCLGAPPALPTSWTPPQPESSSHALRWHFASCGSYIGSTWYIDLS